MTSRERLRAALNHITADRPALDIGGSYATGINTAAYRNLKTHLRLDTPTELASKRSDIARVDEVIRKRLRIDTYPLLAGAPDGAVLELPDGSYQDEWRVVRSRAEGGHYYVTQPPLAEAGLQDLDPFPWPDPNDPGWSRGLLEEAIRIHQDSDYALVLSLPVGFGHQSQFLRGYDQWLVDCALDPAFVGRLMDHVIEIHMQIAANILAELEDLVDVVLYADDMGFQDRPILSPSMFRRLIKPRQKRFLEHIKARTAAKVLYHTCGSIYSLIPDFIEAGVDVLNPVQTTAAHMDPAQLKREFGRDLAFWGAVDTQRLLPQASPAEVEAQVRQLVETLGSDGGYVVSAANNIQADTPAENILAMATGCQPSERAPVPAG